MSLDLLAAVLLVPVLLVMGLRTRRWRPVVVAGAALALAAALVPVVAVVIVVSALVLVTAGALLVGTGAHAVDRQVGTFNVAELLLGGLALRWWRHRQARRWSDSWARRWVDLPRSR